MNLPIILRALTDYLLSGQATALDAAYRLASIIDALRSWSFTAMDRNPLCAGITAAQLLANQWIHQVPLGELVVYAGDTLGSVEDWQVVVHQAARPPCSVLPALHPARTEAVKAAAQQVPGYLRPTRASYRVAPSAAQSGCVLIGFCGPSPAGRGRVLGDCRF